MKILYTAFDVVPAPKGASVRIQHMLRHLAAQATELSAVVLGEPGFPEREITSEGIQYIRLTTPTPSFLERTVVFAEKVLETFLELRPDVVQFRSLWDAYPLIRFCRAQGFSPRLIYELHGLPEFELEHHFEDLSEALLHKIRQQQQYILEQADLVITPSEVHLDFLKARGVPESKRLQVPNGVDTDHFTPPTEMADTETAQDELLRLVYVGTLAPWQGLEHLLEALNLFQHLTPRPFQIQWVGKGQRRWIRDLMTRAFQLRLSHVLDVVGPIPYDQVPEFIRPAHIALAPLDTSDRNCVQGCMPLKILEYMACGRAIIASDLPVNRALLQHEHNALLYAPEDDEALAKAILRLAENPQLRGWLGEQARADARREFSWSARLQPLNLGIIGADFSEDKTP